MMSNIVRLVQRPQPETKSPMRHASGSGAEIILFPGVRYERWESSRAGLVGNAADTTGVRRDVIDL